MSGALPDPLLLAAVIFGLTAVYALYETCRWLAARKAPVPGNATPSPMVAAPRPPRLRQPPAPGPHGHHVATVNIWADGYTETAYTTTGHTEIHRGECPQCTAARGGCTWCTFYPRWDRTRERYVHQWEPCPAHAEARRP